MGTATRVTAIFVGGPRHGQWHRVDLDAGRPPQFVDVATGGHADGEPATGGMRLARPPLVRYARRQFVHADRPGHPARWSYVLPDVDDAQLRDALRRAQRADSRREQVRAAVTVRPGLLRGRR